MPSFKTRPAHTSHSETAYWPPSNVQPPRCVTTNARLKHTLMNLSMLPNDDVLSNCSIKRLLFKQVLCSHSALYRTILKCLLCGGLLDWTLLLSDVYLWSPNCHFSIFIVQLRVVMLRGRSGVYVKADSANMRSILQSYSPPRLLSDTVGDYPGCRKVKLSGFKLLLTILQLRLDCDHCTILRIEL